MSRLAKYLKVQLDDSGDGRVIASCPECCEAQEFRWRKGRLVSWECSCDEDEILEAIKSRNDDGKKPKTAITQETYFDRIERDARKLGYEGDDDAPKRRKRPGRQRERIQTATTGTALINRLPVFAPTNRPEHAQAFSATRRNQYGEVTISGPRQLTQAHSDLFRSLLVIRGKSDDATVEYTMSQLRRVLGRRINQRYRIDLLKDLRDTSIELRDTDGEVIAYFSFIDGFKRLKREPKIKQFGEMKANPKQKYRVYLNGLFLDFCQKDLALAYPELVPIINTAKHASTKAVAHYVVSHDKVNQQKEQTVFHAIGASRPLDRTRFHKGLIEDAEVLRNVGIEHDADRRRLSYRRNKSRVFVQIPKDRRPNE